MDERLFLTIWKDLKELLLATDLPSLRHTTFRAGEPVDVQLIVRIDKLVVINSNELMIGWAGRKFIRLKQLRAATSLV